jgi:hypothetical protein
VAASLAAVVVALPFRLSSPALIPAPLSLLISVKLYAAVALWPYLTSELARARRAGIGGPSSRRDPAS